MVLFASISRSISTITGFIIHPRSHQLERSSYSILGVASSQHNYWFFACPTKYQNYWVHVEGHQKQPASVDVYFVYRSVASTSTTAINTKTVPTSQSYPNQKHFITIIQGTASIIVWFDQMHNQLRNTCLIVRSERFAIHSPHLKIGSGCLTAIDIQAIDSWLEAI